MTTANPHDTFTRTYETATGNPMPFIIRAYLDSTLDNTFNRHIEQINSAPQPIDTAKLAAYYNQLAEHLAQSMAAAQNHTIQTYTTNRPEDITDPAQTGDFTRQLTLKGTYLYHINEDGTTERLQRIDTRIAYTFKDGFVVRNSKDGYDTSRYTLAPHTTVNGHRVYTHVPDYCYHPTKDFNDKTYKITHALHMLDRAIEELNTLTA